MVKNAMNKMSPIDNIRAGGLLGTDIEYMQENN